MRLAFPIDIFSKKRLIYNAIIYIGYAVIFMVSFLAAQMIVLGFPPAGNLDWIILINVFLPVMVIKFFIFNFFNFKRFALYSSDLYDILKSAILILLSVASLCIMRPLFSPLHKIPSFFFYADAFFSFGAIIVFNSAFRYLYFQRATLVSLLLHRKEKSNGSTRYLIVGAGSTGQSLYQTLLYHKSRKYIIAGFLDDNPEMIGKQIDGIRIFGPIHNVVDIARKFRANQLIIAMPSAPAKRIREIIDSVKETSIKVSTVPSYVEIIEGNVRVDNIREIKIEDILSRDKIEIDLKLISEKVAGKNILITGAAGSIGSEISRQIIRFNPSVLIALDQAETPLFYLERELNALAKQVQVVPVVGDITNRQRLMAVFQEYHPFMVLHAAAYKHVPIMEENFKEAIINNVLGTKNVADLAHSFQTELFLMISTDKAVNPSSVMGLTKRISEIYIQSLDQISRTRYVTVRFGNVLDSAGNVTQLFRQQIAQGGPVTVTHPDMTRYFMVTSEAVQLVLQAGFSGNGGEIFLLDMGEPVRIVDLAKTMIKIAGYEAGKDIEIVFTGLRPGEKLFEELRYDGERLMKTPHPKIFVWKSREYDSEMVGRVINEIISSVYLCDREEIIHEIIENLVPEFQNGESGKESMPKLAAGIST